jgi:hypothetical protein
MIRPDGERIAVLEVQIDTLLANQVEMKKDLSEVKEILQQARGAKWVVVIAAAISGFIATYLPWLAHFLGIIKSA